MLDLGSGYIWLLDGDGTPLDFGPTYARNGVRPYGA